MTRQRLTIDTAKHMDAQTLTESVYGLLEPYEMHQDLETEAETEHRIAKTLDEVPDLYAWFLTLHAYFDHWTDAFKELYGQQDTRYKAMRQKRDLCEKAASAAKLRYEGTSRRLTQMTSHREETNMLRSR
jgi:hypothetical protein